jgi:TonB family protein
MNRMTSLAGVAGAAAALALPGCHASAPAPAAPGTLSAPSYARVDYVQGRAVVVFLADAVGRVQRSLFPGPDFEVRSAALYRRVPVLWTSNGDSVVVHWVVQPAELRGASPDATPPALPAGRRLEDGPSFTPFEEYPQAANMDEVARGLRAHLPGTPRLEPIAGSLRGHVALWLFITADGAVARAQIDRSSGRRELDEAALAAVALARFRPALRGGQAVPAWSRFALESGPAGRFEGAAPRR